MYNFKVFFSLIFITSSVLGEDILELSDEEYYQLPELFVLENYERCLSQSGHAYCAGTFELTAEGPSPLYETLKKFSENSQENYNHTRLHRATCLGHRTTCVINGSLEHSFEDCISKRTMKEYGLNAKIIDLFFCRSSGEKRSFDKVDIAFIVYFSIILLMNLLGTVYHYYIKEENSEGNQWIMSFSLIDNWKRLTSPSVGGDPRLRNFGCFNGIKSILMLLVHLSHATYVANVSFNVNPRYVEQTTRRPESVAFLSGAVLVQSFIVITNFLIGYRTLIFSEKYKLKFWMLPKVMIYRLVRIYPMQLTVIGFTSTIYMYVSDGALWNKYVLKEVQMCRATWWQHLLFINNFFAPGCMSQAWYMATDVQLFLISCSVMLWIIEKDLNAEYVLKRLIAFSLAFVFIMAYTLELKSSLQFNNPEAWLSFYAEEKSYKLLYQSFWGNLPSAFIGLLSACIYYRLEKDNADLSKNKVFVAVSYLTLPMVFAWIFMSYFFVLTMKNRLSVSLYATIDKPGLAIIMALIIFISCSKLNGLWKQLLCWRGWLVLSRMSLGALLVHVAINKILVYSRITAPTFYPMALLGDWFAVSVMTYLIATPLTLLVEYPAVQLFKTYTGPEAMAKVEEKYGVNENNITENTSSDVKNKQI